MNDPVKPKVVDLFSGCGGLSLGFQAAGFTVIGAYDSWQAAVETYRANFEHPVTLTTVETDTSIPDSDVIIGGPPCQGFSSAGLRKKEDARNTLVSTFSAIVAKKLPRAFVFENVEGFLTGEGGHFVNELLAPLIQAGYRIHLRKINASNYGVPQHRKRVVAVGGLGWDPSFPLHSHATLGAPGATLLNGHSMPFAPTLEEALTGLPIALPRSEWQSSDDLDHYFAPFSEADLERARMLKPGGRMRDLPEELWHDSYKKRANRRVRDGTPTERRGGAPSGLRRLQGDEPSKAITGGALREFVHPSEDRPLTLRECARLQTFPDDFVFRGTQGEKIQMIGNAVPPLLAKQVAASLLRDLNNNPRNTRGSGALLSFLPTASSGMSPALQQVVSMIEERFGGSMKDKQGVLCL